MAESVFKKIQLVGTSTKSLSDAIANAVARGAQMERGLCWFEVTEHRGRIAEGKIQEYQVTVNLGVRMD